MKQMLTNKICLVTGTGKGIGKEITRRFIEEGALVYANVRHEKSLEDMTAKDNLIPIYFDLTDKQSIKDAVMRIKKEHNRIDVLVNNAGVVSNEVIGMISTDKMKEMFEVNVFGMLELTQMVATRFMMKQKSGSIINITSMVGVEGCKGQIAYSASKGAVISITKSMAKELSGNNIRVNAIAPGMIDTERLIETIESVYHGNISNIGMGRLGKPEEIADAVLYFASDLSQYTTGQILGVHGSITL